MRTSRISCTLRPCKHSCVNIHRNVEKDTSPLGTLMVSIRTCTDAATKDVPCRRSNDEVKHWKIASWGSMSLCCLAQKFGDKLQPSYFKGVQIFRNPGPQVHLHQGSQPLAITREHSDRSQRGYANLKRWPRDQMSETRLVTRCLGQLQEGNATGQISG